MPEAIVQQLAVYLHLALASERRGRPLVSNRLWVLANDLAWRAGMPWIAAHCRQQVLRANRHHLLARWKQYQVAFADPDYQALLASLKKQYPLERAELLLERLGIQLGASESFDSELEYLASILKTTPAQLAERFGDA